MALVEYLGKPGQGMSDLICANCKHFNYACCPPRCETHQYAYAHSDTPACARFSRLPEAHQFTPASLSNRRFNDESCLERLKAIGYSEHDLEISNPFNSWMRDSNASA